jgi:hypothetical protein
MYPHSTPGNFSHSYNYSDLWKKYSNGNFAGAGLGFEKFQVPGSSSKLGEAGYSHQFLSI